MKAVVCYPYRDRDTGEVRDHPRMRGEHAKPAVS